MNLICCLSCTQSVDVASALCSLRQKAKNAEPSLSSSVPADKVEVKSKANIELESFIANCHKRKRPKMQQSFQGSVASRMGTEENGSNAKSSSSSGKPSFDTNTTKESQKNLAREHFSARRQMAMHHRASHERLRDMVLSTSDRVMNIMTSGKMKPNFSRKQVIEFAKLKLNEGLGHIRQALVSGSITYYILFITFATISAQLVDLSIYTCTYPMQNYRISCLIGSEWRRRVWPAINQWKSEGLLQSWPFLFHSRKYLSKLNKRR